MAAPSLGDLVGIISQSQSLQELLWVLGKVDAVGLGGKLISPGHWRQSQLPNMHAHRVDSPLPVVRGGAIAPECSAGSLAIVSRERQGQLSQGQ